MPKWQDWKPTFQSYRANYTTAQTDAAFLTVAAGQKAIVTQAQIVASNANTASPACRVGFGTSTCPVDAGVIISHPGIPAGGGVSRGNGEGIIAEGADNEDIRVTCGVPTGGSIDVIITYFTQAV